MDQKKCQPCRDIRIYNVRNTAYQDVHKRPGVYMSTIIRKQIRDIVSAYPDDLPAFNGPALEICINGLGDDKHKVTAIANALGVSVSDFLKVKLFEDQLKDEKKWKLKIQK